MSTIYSGSPVLNTSISIPVDGDLADANSVNISSKAMMDMQIFLLRTYGQAMQSTAPIRVRDNNDGANILIDPISLVVVNESGTWKSVFTTARTTIGIANIEGGPGFYQSNTWYYIYAYSMGGVCSFQSSTSPPDIYGLYKSGTFSHKYIASFKTSGASVLGFNKYGNYTQYQNNLSIGTGNSLSETALSSDVYIPPITGGGTMSRMCKILVQFDNTLSTDAKILTMIPRPGALGYDFYIPVFANTTFIVDMPADDLRKIYYKVNSNTGNPTVLFTIYGYYE